MATDLFFVSQNFDGEDIRSKELKQSSLRAHAARFAYKKKCSSPLALQTAAKSATKTTDSIRGKCKNYRESQQYENESEDEESIAKQRASRRAVAYTPRRQSSTAPRNVLTDLDKLSPVFWHVSARSGGSFSDMLGLKNLLTKDFLGFMSDEAMFHAGSAVIKYELDNLINPGIQSRDVLDHKTKALRMIRRRIQTSPIVDNATILAILVLPNCENICNLTDAYIIHWNAAARLISARQPKRPIANEPGGPYLNMVIAAAAPCFKAMTHLDMPSEEAQPLETTTRSPTFCLQSHDLPRGFRALLDRGKIGPPTLALLENYYESLCKASTMNLNNRLSASFQQAWSTFDLRRSTILGEPSIEEIIQCALTIYILRPIGPVGMTGFLPRSFQELFATKIGSCELVRSKDEEATLYWAWAVLVDSCKTRFGDLPGVGLFLRNIQAQRFPHWSANAQESDGILRLYLYNEDFLKCHKRFMIPHASLTTC